MKLYKNLAILLTSVLLFGLATLTSTHSPTSARASPPGKGGFDPVPIQAGRLDLDSSTGSVVQAELAEDASLVSAAPAEETAPAVKRDDPAPTPIRLTASGGKTFKIVPNSVIAPHDLLLIGSPTQNDLTGQEIDATGSTSITFEDFESSFPTGLWTRSGTHQWDDVNCLPVAGSRSAWPAADVANPCNGANYPNNMDSLLKYGPFSLADAQSASLDFFFRMVSESCTPIIACDYLFWGVSTNGTNFFGDFAAGDYTGGPFPNGYNFASLDLSYLAGESQVWIGFAFVSDGSFVAQGPFIDLISLRKNSDARTYLTYEDFEVTEFPNPTWESFDLDGTENGEYYWDDVSVVGQGGSSCPPRSGDWSIWPADEGADGLNPCAGDDYANNMISWMIHGPFSLADASEAWVDFYFRNQSEVGYDFLFWGASSDGFTFYGPPGNTGTYVQGPHDNGYNLMRLNLSNVPDLGDLRGQPTVWLAFIFESDSSNIIGGPPFQGPFIDDVSVVVERTAFNELFLPIVFKIPQPTIPKTNLFINNQTGGVITNYKVLNPKLNGVSIPDIICANIPAGATRFDCHATFDTGTYGVSSTNTCNPPTTTGQVTFNPGDDVRLIRCLSNP